MTNKKVRAIAMKTLEDAENARVAESSAEAQRNKCPDCADLERQLAAALAAKVEAAGKVLEDLHGKYEIVRAANDRLQQANKALEKRLGELADRLASAVADFLVDIALRVRKIEKTLMIVELHREQRRQGYPPAQAGGGKDK
jgi:flagellar motility protein MotE (MotC chaperone)